MIKNLLKICVIQIQIFFIKIATVYLKYRNKYLTWKFERTRKKVLKKFDENDQKYRAKFGVGMTESMQEYGKNIRIVEVKEE
jgi:hypothetical protein